MRKRDTLYRRISSSHSTSTCGCSPSYRCWGQQPMQRPRCGLTPLSTTICCLRLKRAKTPPLQQEAPEPEQVRKRVFLSTLYNIWDVLINMSLIYIYIYIHVKRMYVKYCLLRTERLPRRARDKHRRRVQNTPYCFRFLQGISSLSLRKNCSRSCTPCAQSTARSPTRERPVRHTPVCGAMV